MAEKKETNFEEFLYSKVDKRDKTWEQLIASMTRKKIQNKEDFKECCNDCRLALWRGLTRYDESKSNGKSKTNYLFLQIDGAINSYARKYYREKYKKIVYKDPQDLMDIADDYILCGRKGIRRKKNDINFDDESKDSF